MKNYGVLAVIPALAIVAGCTSFTAQHDLATLEKTEAVGTPFTQALTEEYREFAYYEYAEMYDWPDAGRFAKKGLATSQGEVVQPESLDAWNIPSGSKGDLGQARARLISAFDDGARDKAPSEAARAQAKFDCWVEQQEENWQWDHIAACRDAYYAAIDNLEKAMQPALAFAPEEPEIAVPVAVAAPLPRMLFFDFDKAKLKPETLNSLDELAADVRANKVNNIIIAGHADRSGSQAYNMTLSEKRATAVAKALNERDVPFGVMDLTAHGEDKPMVPTADGKREPRNRVVIVEFTELPQQATKTEGE